MSADDIDIAALFGQCKEAKTRYKKEWNKLAQKKRKIYTPEEKAERKYAQEQRLKDRCVLLAETNPNIFREDTLKELLAVKSFDMQEFDDRNVIERVKSLQDEIDRIQQSDAYIEQMKNIAANTTHASANLDFGSLYNILNNSIAKNEAMLKKAEEKRRKAELEKIAEQKRYEKELEEIEERAKQTDPDFYGGFFDEEGL
jgi:hypothetical protein